MAFLVRHYRPRQSILWMLVDNEIHILQAMRATLVVAALANPRRTFQETGAMAKLIVSEGASGVVDRLMHIHGGYGVTKDFLFERWYREIRISRIGQRPSEVQRQIIAGDILVSTQR